MFEGRRRDINISGPDVHFLVGAAGDVFVLLETKTKKQKYGKCLVWNSDCVTSGTVHV